jgi:hypothetical protein
MSACHCSAPRIAAGSRFDTDEYMTALKGVVDLLCPTKPGQDLDMVDPGHLYTLLDILVKQLEDALARERHAQAARAAMRSRSQPTA